MELAKTDELRPGVLHPSSWPRPQLAVVDTRETFPSTDSSVRNWIFQMEIDFLSGFRSWQKQPGKRKQRCQH